MHTQQTHTHTHVLRSLLPRGEANVPEVNGSGEEETEADRQALNLAPLVPQREGLEDERIPCGRSKDKYWLDLSTSAVSKGKERYDQYALAVRAAFAREQLERIDSFRFLMNAPDLPLGCDLSPIGSLERAAKSLKAQFGSKATVRRCFIIYVIYVD